jgi:hypothetical protein
LKAGRDSIELSLIRGELGINGDFANYRDTDEAKIRIPLSVIIRLYDLAKFETERRGQDWEAFCNKQVFP